MAKCSKPRGSTSTGIRLPANAPRQDVDKFEAQALAQRRVRHRRRAAALPLELFPAHLEQRLFGRLLRLSVDPDARRRTRSHWFETHGGLTRANGQRFRDMVLSRGNTLDYAEMYRAFAGHDPSIQPYLEYYGLPAEPAPAAAPGSAAAASAGDTAADKGERGR